MNFALAIQVFSFIAQNKDSIKQLVLTLESVVAELAGPEKAAIVKQYIGAAMNIGDQLETAWPLVAPMFNAFVAIVKKPA